MSTPSCSPSLVRRGPCWLRACPRAWVILGSGCGRRHVARPCRDRHVVLASGASCRLGPASPAFALCQALSLRVPDLASWMLGLCCSAAVFWAWLDASPAGKLISASLSLAHAPTRNELLLRVRLGRELLPAAAGLEARSASPRGAVIMAGSNKAIGARTARTAHAAQQPPATSRQLAHGGGRSLLCSSWAIDAVQKYLFCLIAWVPAQDN